MKLESLLDDIHKGIVTDPKIIILAKALEAERDAHLSTRNFLTVAVTRGGFADMFPIVQAF